MQDSLNGNYLLRKFHSLTGILPVGFFLMFHIWENSLSRRDHMDGFGAGYYNEHVVHFIKNINYIQVLEVLLLAAIAFHAIWGVVIWWQGKSNVGRYRYLHNWGYFLQRVTALIAFAFIAFHVLTTRFAVSEGADLFAHMQAQLQSTGTMLIYIVGVLAAAFHLAYGLWLLGITWGITTHPRSQKLSLGVAAAVFVALAVMGMHGLWGFNQAFFA